MVLVPYPPTAMRLCVALGCLLLVGCTGPHSTGALWAQQNVERELALFRVSDAQRADQARVYERGLADANLADERSRIGAGLRDCPGQARPALGMSVGDRVRDTIRLRAQGDRARLALVAQVAQADWFLRRAQATGDARICDLARDTLDGRDSSEPTASDALERLGSATVTRDLRRASEIANPAWPAAAMLSAYALGYVDTVQAAQPLPSYLAAVYGGALIPTPAAAPAVSTDSPPAANGETQAVPNGTHAANGSQLTANGETAVALVDRLARAYPEWEPDALYAAFVAP